MYTKDMLYKCIECGQEEVVLAKDIKDGKRCKACGGYSSPRRFVNKHDGLTPHTCIIDEMHNHEEGKDAKDRTETIRKLRRIADDLEKGCDGWGFLIGFDLSSLPDKTVYQTRNKATDEIFSIEVAENKA